MNRNRRAKKVMEEIGKEIDRLTEEPNNQRASSSGQANEPSTTPSPENLAAAFITGVPIAWEIYTPLLFRPVESFSEWQANPDRVDQLIMDYTKLLSSVGTTETRLNDHSTSFSRDVQEMAARNLQHISAIAQSNLDKLAQYQIDMDNETDEDIYLMCTARGIAADCAKFREDFNRLNNLLNGIHSTLSTHHSAQSSRPPSAMAEEAARIASMHVENPEYAVFISHGGEDKYTMAIPLRNKLRELGIAAFVDKMDLKVGSVAPDDMKRAMASAVVGVFILSPEFAAKKWTMLELMTFQKRFENAKQNGKEDGPKLIPLFYRLLLKDCEDQKLFWRQNSEGRSIFVECGFSERAANKETSVPEVLESLKSLSKWTGVENVESATNEDCEFMQESRDRLLDQLAAAIADALK